MQTSTHANVPMKRFHLEELSNGRPKISTTLYISVLVMSGLVVVGWWLLFVLPTLHGPNSRQLANEAIAVRQLRIIVTLQNEYSDTHGGNRFACELALLKPVGPDELDYDLSSLLTTGMHSGYRFSLPNCGSDRNGARSHYEATAVPLERGVTGLWTFCTNETGVIRYDEAGSMTNCLAFGRALQELNAR